MSNISGFCVGKSKKNGVTDAESVLFLYLCVQTNKEFAYDREHNGVRNAVLSNFAPLELRNDVGLLWENLMVSERMKRNVYAANFAQLYFWRTHEQQEIDLVEEQDGMLRTFELKWNGKARATQPASFAKAYPDTDYEILVSAKHRDSSPNSLPFMSWEIFVLWQALLLRV